MSDEEDTADPTKSSRRNRLKAAVARTGTKLVKRNKETTTTVDDFLAAGRGSTSTGRPSVSDSFAGCEQQEHAHPSNQGVHDGFHPTDSVSPPQLSPRRIVVPKIDVSNSQRYPTAQVVDQPSHEQSASSSLLRPEYRPARGQATSSFSKGRGRARGLSVQFTDRPPIVIGEGGDEAETPTIEVGRAKARARSASPPGSAGSPNKGARTWNKSPLQYIPRAGTSSPKQGPMNAQRPQQSTTYPPAGSAGRDAGTVPSPGIIRVQTGTIGASPSPMSESKQAMDKEFEMSMGISPATTNSPAPILASAEEPTMIHAPKPIHPPVAVPNVNELPALHELKRGHGTKSLRKKFAADEGASFLEAHRGESPVSPLNSSDEHFSPPSGPPPGRQVPKETVSPPSHPGSAWRSPQPPQGISPNPPPPRPIPASDEFASPPGPPPRRREVDESYAPPPGPPPGRKPAEAPFTPPPGPPPRRPPPNDTMAHLARPPPGQPQGPPPPPPPPQRNPDDEYMGWVPDDVHQSQAPTFPGVDAAGKLTPFPGVDEKEDNKPEKQKRRWFRRGS